ncbi:hypothetical protein WKW50_24365 [Ochrobactrum sp. GPK 3]|uniref:hypothetical protein n=1 Tax=Brucella sp. 22210 TaxID=3453892 RepID=UPI0031385450
MQIDNDLHNDNAVNPRVAILILMWIVGAFGFLMSVSITLTTLISAILFLAADGAVFKLIFHTNILPYGPLGHSRALFGLALGPCIMTFFIWKPLEAMGWEIRSQRD